MLLSGLLGGTIGFLLSLFNVSAVGHQYVQVSGRSIALAAKSLCYVWLFTKIAEGSLIPVGALMGSATAAFVVGYLVANKKK